jgi:hypothetical protein
MATMKKKSVKRIASKNTKAKNSPKKKALKKATKKKNSKKKTTIKKKTVKKKNTKKQTITKKKTSKKNSKKNNINSKTTKVPKKISKQVSANKKKDVSQDKEIAKLRKEVNVLKKTNKKKVNPKRLTQYNLFVRKQIKSGLTFEQAVKEWNKFKKLETKQKRKPTAYNQFIGSQMKLGKTFTQSVALWKLAKSGKLGKKGTTKTITKTKYRTRTVQSKPKVIVKRIKSKPKIIEKIKYRTRTKKVPTKKKTSVQKKDINYDKLKEMFSQTIKESNSNIKISEKEIRHAVEANDEDIAFKIVQTYFKELARFGFKKQLTLDEVIDGYLYSLAKVKKQEGKDFGVSQRVRKSGLTK